MKQLLKHCHVEFLEKEESEDDMMQQMFYSSPIHSAGRTTTVVLHVCYQVTSLTPGISFHVQAHWLMLIYFL